MKTRAHRVGRRSCRFQLRMFTYGSCYYIERIEKLERLLARNPRTLTMDMIGVGEIPADFALLFRSILRERSQTTRLITNARSSLQGGAVLVWLMGDERNIREDARVFFRRTTLSDEDHAVQDDAEKETDTEYHDSFSEIDPEEGDYAKVLEFINEFLPVKELAGRLINVFILQQFGLVKNEKVDRFLANAFAKSEQSIQAIVKPSEGSVTQTAE